MVRFLVIVPTFNSSAYLDEALASLAIQRGPFDLHVHVQDGGSADNTAEVISRWQPRFTERQTLTWASEKDRGMYDAIRRGAEHLQPDQIMTWLGSDDLLMIGTLATVASIFDEHQQVEWLTGLPFVGTQEGGNYTPWPYQPPTRQNIAAGLHDGRSLNFIMQEGTFWRASLWQKVGGIDSRYFLAGDWDLWRRFAQHAPLYFVSFPLARFTKRPGQKSQDMRAYYEEVDSTSSGPLISDHSAFEVRRMAFAEQWKLIPTVTAANTAKHPSGLYPIKLGGVGRQPTEPNENFEMRIALIDHSYRQTTQSIGFFHEILAALGSIQHFYDETWRGGENLWRTTFNESDYDLIVIFQVHEAFAVLSGKHPNVVFVPMYDGMLSGGQFHWKPEFAKARTVSFSRALHQEVTKRDGLSRYFKYFPDPTNFKTVSDFEEIRPFYWYRTADISPDLVFAFCKDGKAKSITLHNAPDPEQPPLSISSLPSCLSDIKVTRWFETSGHYRETLTQHNVFFAPRAVEGIGMSFIEAMASGLCVVAPNSPTMNEYIADGTNGLLYSLDRRLPLDFSRAKEIGARARETVERGYADWRRAIPELTEFLAAPTNSQRVQRPTTTSIRPAARAKISVVTVCFNAAKELETTIKSVLNQDWPDVEYVILDGGSTDGSVEIIEKYSKELAYWISTPDKGVYFAMNTAVSLCTGDWVLFMNAGDVFTDAQSLSRMFRYVQPDADIVYGHHLYVPAGGTAEYHPAADFELTWNRLKRGDFGIDWGKVGLPCHQATAVRRSLLSKLRFDTTFRIVADHELLVRAFENGAKYFHCDELVSIYAGGGMSAKLFSLCKQEWARVAMKHGNADTAARFNELLKDEQNAASSQQLESFRKLLLESQQQQESFRNLLLESQRMMRKRSFVPI